VKAAARIVAEADGRGGTRLVELYGEAPLLPRRTGSARVHLVGGAAGPLGGDDLHLDIRVGPGAHLSVHTVAASVALPGPAGSRTLVTATVAEDASLTWLPEPVVAARGCDHRAESRVDLHATARLHWREELVCGRHGESGGDLTLAMTIRRSGASLFRHDLTVGPRAPWFSSPAVLGDARCAGTLVVVSPSASVSPLARPGLAVMPLAGPGYVVSAVAGQAHELRARLSL
jgi:urease accessory protein